MREKRQRRKEGRDILEIFVMGRHIRAVGCMLEIEGWVAGGTLEDEEEEEEASFPFFFPSSFFPSFVFVFVFFISAS